MTYGETTRQNIRTVYCVESNFPTADQDRLDSNQRFNRYNAHAFTDSRDPGSRKYFVKANEDVCSNRLRGEDLSFKTAEEALACADRLREFGIIACRYETDQAWNLRDRGLPLTVRVVEYHSVEINRVVTA